MRYLWEAIKNRHGVLLEIGSSAGKHLRFVLELGMVSSATELTLTQIR